MEILTKNNHSFYSITSLMQKAIRRGDRRTAVMAANEISENFPMYVSNRSPVILCEDNYGLLAQLIQPLIEDNKKLKLKSNKLQDDEKTIIINKIKINNILIVELLARAKYNRDLQLYKSYHVFFTLSDYANNDNLENEDFFKLSEENLYKAVGQGKLEDTLGILSAIYFYNQSDSATNEEVINYLYGIIDRIINENKFNYTAETLQELDALKKMHNYKYMKTAKKERHNTKDDDSFYMIMRMAFVLCKLYDISYTEDLLSLDDAKKYLGMCLASNYVIPEYAVKDVHNGRISRVEFTMRELEEATNIEECIFTIEKIKEIIINEEI